MALLSSYRFDVVVTDLSVSQLGGLEGMRLIRFVTTNFPDTAVYVLSGYVDENVRSLCAMLGVTAVLEKPEGLQPAPHPAPRAPRRTMAAPAEPLHRPGDTGEVQQVELLEDFLDRQHDPRRAAADRQAAGRRRAVRGLRRRGPGPRTGELGAGQPVVPPRLRGAQGAAVRGGHDLHPRRSRRGRRSSRSRVTTFLNVQPRSLTNPDFTARALRRGATSPAWRSAPSSWS